MITEWPVFDPGSGGIADLYPYVVEIEYAIELDDADLEPFGPDDPTVVTPAARLVERCMTSAALRLVK